MVAIVTVPGATLDACSDRDSFMVKTDPALLRTWDDANEASGIVSFFAPLQPQRCPPQEGEIPPPKWEEEQLSLRSAAVALTITRTSSSAPHSFQKVRFFAAVKDLEAKSRDGLVRVVLEMDLDQRPRSRLLHGPGLLAGARVWTC